MSRLLFAQLDGSATQATNCGVSATRSAVAWATRNAVRPTVKQARARMGKPTGTTNPLDWARAVESYDTPAELAGRYERLTGRTLTGGSWADVEAHLRAGRMALVAVDYGVLRRLAPAKVGSRTFSGYHAIPFRGLDAQGRTTSLDPLLDGRYKGCPAGPVAIPLGKVRQAAVAVGRREAGSASVWAYLPDRAVAVGSGVDVPEPEEPVSLAGVLADLVELRAALAGAQRRALGAAIADLESIVGPYRGPSAGVEPAKGLKP